MQLRKILRSFLVFTAISGLVACGGGADSGSGNQVAYSVGGSISGLSGEITLLNNLGNMLTLTSNGSFIFSSSLASGGAYSVSIGNQPQKQACTVVNGTGTISNTNIANVSIVCSNLFYIGGNVSGLTGSITLLNNGDNALVLASDGTFVFSGGLKAGAAYDIKVGTQPEGKTCTVENGVGVISGNDVSSVAISCTNTITVSIFAGSAICCSSHDGTGTGASFYGPRGVATDSGGNIYVADSQSHLIRKITLAGQVITLAGSGQQGFADGFGIQATFWNPNGIAVDSVGNIFIGEGSNRIRKIGPDGLVTTFAGSGVGIATNGVGTEATFSNPRALAIDSEGNVYVSDAGNNLIRKITPAAVVSTFAGSGRQGKADGKGSEAEFNYPGGLAFDSHGNLYVADAGNNLIRRISQDGTVTTLITTVTIGGSPAIAIDANDNIYLNTQNNKISKITPNGQVFDLATGSSTYYDYGIGVGLFLSPYSFVINKDAALLVSDYAGSKIIKITQ